jgi:hypothetical protein
MSKTFARFEGAISVVCLGFGRIGFGLDEWDLVRSGHSL